MKRTKVNWIKCTDKLPAEFQDVIVYNYRSEIKQCWFEKGYFRYMDNDGYTEELKPGSDYALYWIPELAGPEESDEPFGNLNLAEIPVKEHDCKFRRSSSASNRGTKMNLGEIK